MPEGPEIRRAADRIAEAVVDQPIRLLWFEREDLKPFTDRLRGARVIAVDTVGKAMLTRFDCGLSVYSHNQLYGRWQVVRAGHRPQTNRQLRWIIETEHKAALLYSASEIEVLNDDQCQQHPFISRAGLDVLTKAPSVAEIQEHISQPRFAGRALGGLLLDQQFIAGVGNYLRSEILFDAALHPSTRPGDLDDRRKQSLAEAIERMITRAYQTGGITNDPDRVAQLKQGGWKRSQYRHYVFYRDGQACHHCGDWIRKTSVASRRLYLCASCQPSLR